MARLYIVDQNALSVGGHYHAYSQTIGRSARSAGLEVAILHNRRFTGDWGVKGAAVVPAFKHTWGESEGLWIRAWEPGNIAYEYVHAVRTIPPAAHDHVFFSTIGYAELIALLEYLTKLTVDREAPFFHLLLRYDPDILRAGIADFGPLFSRIARSALLRRKVIFHSDTEPLTKEFSWLTGLPFTRLPIPFQQTHLTKALARREPSNGALVVSYLGDARIEKNFAALPAAVAHLTEDYLRSGKARFVIQSNFSVPGGETGMLQAVQKLGQLPPTMVELLDRPLDGESYYERLAQSDIVVAPYDAERYRARSSGTLVEALAAGKPVVTTRGSWMETQVTSDHAVLIDGPEQLGPALKRLLDEYPAYKAAADRVAPRVLEDATGEAFVQALLASAADRKRPGRPGPHVLVVLDGDTFVVRNGGGVVGASQLRYLTRAGYRISALFLMTKRGWDSAQIEEWTEQLRERVEPFELEAAFVAGSGRLSFDTLRQRDIRERDEHSIAADLERVRAFDISLELSDHLGRNPVDILFLNYAVNAPLRSMLGLNSTPTVCEVHDIQSFQRAIYGGRRVDERDLEQELGLIAGFDELISLSVGETAYIKDRLPQAQVTTTGVYPPLPEVSVRDLAGALTLADVARSSGPQTETKLNAMAAQDGFDLLFVSSNHLSNVSGLLWFLDEVYLPLLAPAGVTFVVAGGIRDAATWPTHDNLYFLGRVDRLEPLYAASRVVVVPVLEGAGVPVKTVEALGRGKPVVATPLAMRGLRSEVEGVEVVESPLDFASAIQSLLASPPLRAERGGAARRSAGRFADPTRYAEIMDRVMGRLLGERALSSPAEAATTTDRLVEWTPMVRALNRLVRAWLSDAPLEEAALVELDDQTPEDVDRTLDQIVDALIVSRSAPLLETDTSLLRQIARCEPHDGRRVRDVLAFMRDAQALDDDENQRPGHARIAFAARVPLEVFAWTPGSLSGPTVEAQDQLVNFAPAGGGGAFSGRLRGRPKAVSGVSAAEVLVAGSDVLVFSQPALLESGRSVLLTSGGRALVTMGPLVGSGSADRLLDLVFKNAAGAIVEIRTADGKTLPASETVVGERRILRCKLPEGGSLAPVNLTLSMIAGEGILLGGTMRLVVGDKGFAALEMLDDYEMEQGKPGGLQGGDDQTSGARRSATVARERVTLHLPASLSIVDVAALLQEPGREAAWCFVASGGLTVDVKASYFDRSEVGRAACTLDGQEGTSLESEGVERRWRFLGSAQPGEHVRRRDLAFTSRDSRAPPLPAAAEITFHLPAAHDRQTGSRFLELANAYPVEGTAKLPYCWTGPRRSTKLSLPLALTQPGQLRLGVVNIGANREPGEIVLTLDGTELQTSVAYSPGWAVFSAEFQPPTEPRSHTELVIFGKRRTTYPGDPRALGLAIGYVEFVVSV